MQKESEECVLYLICSVLYSILFSIIVIETTVYYKMNFASTIVVIVVAKFLNLP